VLAPQCFQRSEKETSALNDTSAAEQVEEAAVALWEAMAGTLNSHARAKRWCSRSKLWSTEELVELQKQLGRVR